MKYLFSVTILMIPIFFVLPIFTKEKVNGRNIRGVFCQTLQGVCIGEEDTQNCIDPLDVLGCSDGEKCCKKVGLPTDNDVAVLIQKKKKCKQDKKCTDTGGKCIRKTKNCKTSTNDTLCSTKKCTCCSGCTLETKCKERNGKCRTTECKAKEIELPKGCKEDGCKCCIKVCGVVNKQVRIVGGEETLVHEYPWQAGLTFVGFLGGYRAWCGASILSRRWILTAAHCFKYSTNPSNYHVVVGEHNWNTSDETTFTERVHVKKLVLHPKYNKPTDWNNDIALIKLKSELTFTQQNRVAPICLPPLGTQDKFENISAIVSGWGTLSSEGIQSNVLHDVTVSTVSNAQCQQDYESSLRITDGMICAGVPEGGKDSCQGDSGGPLITEADEGDRMIQIGVISLGMGCGLPDYPGVYARVSHYMPWILKYVDDAAY